MTEQFQAMLTGGHPNSLGRTGEVVDAVLADRDELEHLFAAIDSPDEVVRLRVGDALEKVCRERPEWFVEYVGRLLGDIGQIEQPSVQWHVAQMLDHLRGRITKENQRLATQLLQHNLATSTDWIVLNVTMDILTRWAADDSDLATWLLPQLQRLQSDPRNSVAKRATKHAAQLGR